MARKFPVPLPWNGHTTIPRRSFPVAAEFVSVVVGCRDEITRPIVVEIAVLFRWSGLGSTRCAWELFFWPTWSWVP